MTSGDETAQVVARIQSRATMISALLGCIGVIVAAWIGAAVGRNQGREESKQKVTSQDAQIAQRDDRIAQLTAENDSLKRRIGQTMPTSNASAGDNDEDKIYKGTVIAQRQEQGFSIKFYGCRRGSNAVKCYFDVTNTMAERKFQLAGYPGDQRYSRAYDDHGQQHTANTPEVSGATQEVTIPDGLTVRASLVFATVPANVQQFTDLKVVFFYAYKEYAVDFRDIKLG
jgi:hypothetical protein